MSNGRDYTLVKTLGERMLLLGSFHDYAADFRKAATSAQSAGYIPVEVEVVLNWTALTGTPRFRVEGDEAQTEARILNLTTVVSISSPGVDE